MLILHANWTNRRLHLWAESLSAFQIHCDELAGRSASANGSSSSSDDGAVATLASHPFVLSPEELRDVLGASEGATGDSCSLRLPTADGQPLASDRLTSIAAADEQPPEVTIASWSVATLSFDGPDVMELFRQFETLSLRDDIRMAHDIRYWMAAIRFVIEALVDQRFVPTIMRRRGVGVEGAWYPWLHDESLQSTIGALLHAMPPVCRAVEDLHDGRPWPVLEEMILSLTDTIVRMAMVADDYEDALYGREASEDDHVAWLSGLLKMEPRLELADERAGDLIRDVSTWIDRLDDGEKVRRWRVGFELIEPLDLSPDATAEEAAWTLQILARPVGQDCLPMRVESLWEDAGVLEAADADGRDVQEVVLGELGRASRLYPELESALAGAVPGALSLDTHAAYAFLKDIRPLLEESGFDVIIPTWWDQPSGRLNARLQIDALDDGPRPGGAADAVGSVLGLDTLVRYRWQVSVGDETLPVEEFERLTEQAAPLVRVRGRWVEIRPEDLDAAVTFLRENDQGEMTLGDAARLAFGLETSMRRPALPVAGIDASGWVGDLMEATTERARLPQIDAPELFKGELRPYQLTGLRWLVFLDTLGLGACLADDMGLGKTIQLIALLQYERARASRAEDIGPTVLIVPTSLIANWQRELVRFSPELKSLIHHGPDRRVGDAFEQAAMDSDVVITTYGLAARDHDTIGRLPWHRVVLDEAQYIKNPPTKQTAAIRALRTDRRIALTGTPLENRLTELWSIMEFCNPGYLGSTGEFRRRFAVPIERHRDEERAKGLRDIVQPFILRRLKTDPTVISDLPACVQTKEYATLTAEQAALYENVVRSMLGEVDGAEGMQRRGLVLATLIKLKQICNHPAQLQKTKTSAHLADVVETPSDVPPWHPRRSGKCARLVTMLEEVVASDGKALVFTQFRQMGHLLASMIQNELDCDVLFMHGGTPQKKRQQFIDRFQSEKGGAPVFILSLKAGGVGLNLTAANHVFHFDRWWNPAVEKQATDRAFRIGQTRTVHVHKFVCTGTLEEHIDQLIEQKTELAENIIGSGENWLTELTTGQLRDLLTLRDEALDGEG